MTRAEVSLGDMHTKRGTRDSQNLDTRTQYVYVHVYICVLHVCVYTHNVPKK